MRRGWIRWLGIGVVLAAFLFMVGSPAAWATSAKKSASVSLSAADATVLGVVEGLTEYLPVSSTGHLVITSRILDLPSKGNAGDAMKSYEIAIQFGAILAVLVLYRRRLQAMVEGLFGRSEQGRKILIVGGDRVRPRGDRGRDQRQGDQGCPVRRRGRSWSRGSSVGSQ